MSAVLPIKCPDRHSQCQLCCVSAGECMQANCLPVATPFAVPLLPDTSAFAVSAVLRHVGELFTSDCALTTVIATASLD